MIRGLDGVVGEEGVDFGVEDVKWVVEYVDGVDGEGDEGGGDGFVGDEMGGGFGEFGEEELDLVFFFVGGFFDFGGEFEEVYEGFFVDVGVGGEEEVDEMSGLVVFEEVFDVLVCLFDEDCVIFDGVLFDVKGFFEGCGIDDCS